MQNKKGKSSLTRREAPGAVQGKPVGKGVATTGQGMSIGEEPTQPIAVRPAPIFKQQGVVIARSLHVRKDHNASAATVAGLKSGDKVTVLETWTDGRNTWARIGEGQWAAMVYNGETYIEYV